MFPRQTFFFAVNITFWWFRIMHTSSRRYFPMFRNTRLIITSTLANISGRTEATRILIDDVTFNTGRYLMFEMKKKTACRKLVSENYIKNQSVDRI